jgi:hypothetical protein
MYRDGNVVYPYVRGRYEMDESSSSEPPPKKRRQDEGQSKDRSGEDETGT